MVRTVYIVSALCVVLPTALGAQVILPLLVEGRPVPRVHHAFEDERDGTVWFATSEGLFYTSGGNAVSERSAKDGRRRELRHIARVGDELWVGGEGGVYRIGDQYERVDAGLPAGLTVFAVLVERTGGDETLWLATSEGVFQRRADGTFALELPGESTFLGFADRGKAQPQEETSEAQPPEEIDDRERILWASNSQGFFELNRETRGFEEFDGHEITDVNRVFRDKDGRIYLWKDDAAATGEPGKTGTSLYKHPSGERVGLDSVTPLDAEIIEGLLWYSVDGVIYLVGSTGIQDKDLCSDEIQAIKTIEESRKFLWLVHRYGIHRYTKGGSSSCKQLTMNTGDHEWDVSSTLESGRLGVLFYGAGGVYRLWEGVDIKLKLSKGNYVIVNRYSVGESDYYEGNVRWPGLPGGARRHFSAVITSSEEKLPRELRDPERRFDPVQSWFDFGYGDVYYVEFHDYYGNLRQMARLKAELESTLPLLLEWAFILVVYTVLPTLLVLLLFRWVPFPIRNFLYSSSATVLAPNPFRSFLLLSTAAMRRRLRDICADGWLDKHRSSTKVPDDLMRRIESPNPVFLAAGEMPEVKLKDIASAICGRSTSGRLRDSIPLVYDLRGSGVKSSGDIRRKMNSHMKDVLSVLWFSFLGEGFSSKLLEKGNFVFLFCYDKGDEKVEIAARDFAASYAARRRLVLRSTSPPEVEEESSGNVGRESVKILLKRLFNRGERSGQLRKLFRRGDQG